VNLKNCSVRIFVFDQNPLVAKIVLLWGRISIMGKGQPTICEFKNCRVRIFVFDHNPLVAKIVLLWGRIF
jgi:hypothetical protein